MSINLKETLSSVPETDRSWMEETKKQAAAFHVGTSGWMKETGLSSELAWKKQNAYSGVFMYHAHFCFEDWAQFDKDTAELTKLLKENDLKLDRFGVSIDPSMALPASLRNDAAAHSALYFKDENDWKHLSSVSCSQVHLGDNMIGSPASLDSCVNALKAGITTMGNISQFFGWDYPEFTDVKARTRSTVEAILTMGVHRSEGALIHSNLDDGYGPDTEYISQLLGMAILEKYIVEDLCGAKLAPSFGDDFHSPWKRLVMLSALKQIYGDNLTGSMLFTNKLGRDKQDPSLNDAHLADCLLADMAGQAHYKTGHAITVMADTGLHSKVTMQETVRKLAFAKQLESYVPEILKYIDFEKIDQTAAEQAALGKAFADAVLTAFSSYINIKDPYEVMLAIKTIGTGTLVKEFGYRHGNEIPTDYNHFEH